MRLCIYTGWVVVSNLSVLTTTQLLYLRECERRWLNVNEWCLMTQLQVTTCVFGSSYAFRLIAEGLTCALSPQVFVRLTVLRL